jgi:hypothetical protein
MRIRAIGIAGRKLKVLLACVLFSAAYGAVYGAVLGSLTARAADGARFGAVMGGLSGILGALIGGPWGWCLAGALAAMSPFLVPGHHALENLQLIIPVVIPAFLGGYIGKTVGYGLREGRSPLPGVGLLGKVIYPDGPTKQPAETQSPPTEMTPSGAPEGRGDETTPARSA